MRFPLRQALVPTVATLLGSAALAQTLTIRPPGHDTLTFTLPIELTQGMITGGTGEWDLPLSWPQGITSAVEVYFQSAVFDTTVFGWLTLSNGLQINTL